MKRIITIAVAMAAALAILTGTMTALPAAAQAESATATSTTSPAGESTTPPSTVATRPSGRVTAGCGGGRCTVYLSKAETRSLGSGRVPAPPAFVPTPLRVAYYALAYAHRFFAAQYASRGWCSRFRLSIYPWESQGYAGYAC